MYGLPQSGLLENQQTSKFIITRRLFSLQKLYRTFETHLYINLLLNPDKILYL